jgi:hypothetical protein
VTRLAVFTAIELEATTLARLLGLARVPGARDNAVAWYDYFVRTRRVPPDRVLLLRDAQAGADDVRAAARQAAGLAEKGGTAWLVFIGHGWPQARLVGVEAQGMTACPCAQELVGEAARERLAEQGFTDDEVERVLRAVPIATHNQRGRGTLYVGSSERVNAEQLVKIVESSMSSPVYELLKRPDELFVVEHAHLQPRFVEDSVRLALKGTLETYPGLGDNDFLFSRQVHFETIHNHEVLAERYGTVGELRSEPADGARLSRHTELRDWLSAGEPLVPPRAPSSAP